jgi:hypothetical protein
MNAIALFGFFLLPVFPNFNRWFLEKPENLGIIETLIFRLWRFGTSILKHFLKSCPFGQLKLAPPVQKLFIYRLSPAF